MEVRRTVELVLLQGGRSDDEPGVPPSRDRLHLVKATPGDPQAALEDAVAAGRRVRQDIQRRIARALEDLVRTRAPDSGRR